MDYIRESIIDTNKRVKMTCSKCKQKKKYIGCEFTHHGMIKQYVCKCGISEVLVPR